MKKIWIYFGILSSLSLVGHLTYANPPTLKELAAKKVAENFQTFSQQAIYLPEELRNTVAKNLSPAQLTSCGGQEQQKLWTDARREGLDHFYRDQFFKEFVNIPAVTQEEAHQLVQTIGEDTRIHQAIPAFRAQMTDVSIGQFRAFLHRDPELPDFLSAEQKAEIKRQWDENGDLPATYVNLADQQAFAQAASLASGKRIIVPEDEKSEYMRRGRQKNPDGSFGPITTTRFYFGNAENDVLKRGWFYSNSGNRAHGVHEIVGPEAKDHPFGLINIVGNVYKRASDGSIRGGAFSSLPWHAESGIRRGGVAGSRGNFVGFRVAEEL